LAPYNFFMKTQDMFLVQNVHDFTRQREGQQQSTLDYVFTDEDGVIDSVNHEVPLGKSDHVCLTWDLTVQAENPRSEDSKFNFWKGDYDKSAVNYGKFNGPMTLTKIMFIKLGLPFNTSCLD
jgi:hypothetical protein